MPHALTFIMGYIHINSFNKKIKIKKVFFNKNKWISRFIYENINFDIILEEKIGNNTFLSVQINEDKIERFTEILNGKFINYLIYKNKKIKIKNPISEVFKNLFKNIKNNNFYLRNRIQTISLLDLEVAQYNLTVFEYLRSCGLLWYTKIFLLLIFF